MITEEFEDAKGVIRIRNNYNELTSKALVIGSMYHSVTSGQLCLTCNQKYTTLTTLTPIHKNYTICVSVVCCTQLFCILPSNWASGGCCI